jgi:hypothetical protein
LIAGVQLNLSEGQARFQSDRLDRSSDGFGEHDIECSVGGTVKIDEAVLWPKGLADLVACKQFSRMGEEEC